MNNSPAKIATMAIFLAPIGLLSLALSLDLLQANNLQAAQSTLTYWPAFGIQIGLRMLFAAGIWAYIRYAQSVSGLTLWALMTRIGLAALMIGQADIAYFLSRALIFPALLQKIHFLLLRLPVGRFALLSASLFLVEIVFAILQGLFRRTVRATTREQ